MEELPVNICTPGHSSLCSAIPSPLWAIKLNSAKEHFISFCLKPESTAINSPSEHSGIQIGTLTSEWLGAMLWFLPQGVARRSANVSIQRLSVSQWDSMVLEYGTQNELMADIWHCTPPLRLCRPSLYMHKYICTPSNTRSLCSLWQAQAVCFCGLMSPLYLSVITLELSDPKTKREPVCVPALLAEGPRGLPPSRPFIPALGSYRSTSLGCEEPAQSVCLHARIRLQLTFCLPPCGLAPCLPPSLHRCIRGAFNSANED